MMGVVGVEPTLLAEPDFEFGVELSDRDDRDRGRAR